MNRQMIMSLLWLVPLTLLTGILLIHFVTSPITTTAIHVYTAIFLIIAQLIMFDYFTRQKKIPS
jgi:hypothetical protein